MIIDLRIEFDDADEACEALQRLAGKTTKAVALEVGTRPTDEPDEPLDHDPDAVLDQSPPVEEKEPEPEPEKPKEPASKRNKKGRPKNQPPVEDDTPPAAVNGEYTLEDCRGRMTSLLDLRNAKQNIMGALKKHGVVKIGDLPVEKAPSFVAFCDQLIVKQKEEDELFEQTRAK